ncbi:MAG: divergent polysaccharide deacetylase family protein, partial [Thermodesulfobacteriota bacterium]
KAGPKPKAATPRKKKTRRRKAAPSRFKTYLLGLGLGLVLGLIGTLALIYQPWNRPSPAASIPPAAPTRAPQPPAAGPAQPEVLYEENQALDRLVKTLDLCIYSALGRMKVPEENIHFLEVTLKTKGRKQWDQAVIEVALPPELAPVKAVEGLRAALERGSGPEARLTARKHQGGLVAELYAEGLLTHTLYLVPAASPARAAKPAPPEEKPRARPRAALIIDDFGLSLDQARCFLELECPVAFSILPFLDHSEDVARLAHGKGCPVMLHLPMEPDQYPQVDPGRGALLTSMSRPEIEAKTKAALQAVPFAVGVNNHMGSKFTEDRTRMDWVLSELKKEKVFFVDSRTSNHSVAYDEARRLGLPATKRTVFLDNVPEPQAIRVQLRKLIAQAGRPGGVVGIGHVYPVTCQVLKSEYNYLNSKVELVPITRMFE